jgi:hypothetical protein
MTENAFVIVQYYDALGIRTRGSYLQEIRIRLAEVPALSPKSSGLSPRDPPGAMLVDQIIAAVRSRRPVDGTNAERQRRFRQRRPAQQLRLRNTGKMPA